MTSVTDFDELLQRVAGRDRVAFAALYDASSAKLYGVVLRILKRRDIADEVLQEAYVKIWERAADFDRTIASPMTWMATIARNRALDEVRRKRPVSIEDHPEVADVASDDKDALGNVLASEDGRRLKDCLSRLDEDRRSMVVMAYCDGYSRDELAERFAQPVNTIKTWLRRALLQLRTCLDQ